MWVEDKNLCFVCGKENQEGMQLPIEVDEKGARFKYVIPEKYQGWVGITHGGIIATILDELLAWSTKPKGYSTVTAEISVRFRKPVPVGKEITGEGWITGEEGRLIFAHSRLVDEKGTVLAEATGKLWKI